MAQVTLPYPLTDGTVADGAQVTANLVAIVNQVNGNIDNTNLSNSLTITDSKLSQIQSAAKVNGTALTNFAGIPTGAGVVPTANLPVGTAIGNIVQIVSVNSLPFIPTSIIGGLVGAPVSQTIGTIIGPTTTDVFVNASGYGSVNTGTCSATAVIGTASNLAGGTTIYSFTSSTQNTVIPCANPSFFVPKGWYYEVTFTNLGNGNSMYSMATSS